MLILLLVISLMQTPTIYDYKAESIDGSEIDFGQYKGKKLLIVNTASRCGYTPQYRDLQTLHERYGDQLVILGFPSNNFGRQEPGTNEEIAQFCESNYGVTFQMFNKVEVKGDKQHPLYQWLSNKDLNGWNDKAPSWNFCKYLIDENGKLVKFHKSGTNPLDKEIVEFILG